MRASIFVAAIIGGVVGYNFYLHVWEEDLGASIAVAAASFGVFFSWFNRVTRTQLSD